MPSLDYLAGYFDGEGYIGILPPNKTNKHRLRVSVGNTYLPILEEFKNRFGGYITITNRGINKPVHYWTCSDQIAKNFLQEIYPLLKEKQSQAWLGLEFMAQKTNPVTQEESALRDGFMYAIKMAKGVSA